jgi:hypothetical protein
MLKNEGCPLCEVKQERILHRSQLAIALMDAFPVSALSLEHRHYNASLLSFGDLLGYPVPNPERSAVEYLDVPESIWRAESVFLDEISRCRPEVQNKLFSIIHERQVQGKELARLRYRWAAMNPPIADPIDAGEEADLDGYGGSLPLDPALADRFPYVIVIPGIGDLAREDRLALIAHGDQAICAGYANSLAECDGLPPAHWLARRIARTLFEFRREKGAGQVGPDGKVLVRIACKGRAWRPMSVSISLHHHEASDWVFLDAFAEEAVESACAGRATPDITLNGAGMFVCGGPNGDNGQTGKKLVMDAYGPTVPIGGGAWSGKDFWKVDRRGSLLARAMAQRLVEERGCDEARVTLEYYPGSDAPAHGEAIVDGRRVVLDCRALIGAVVVPKLQAIFTPPKSSGREFDLKEAARWGHHGYLGEFGRELPEFAPSSSAMRSRTRHGARLREDRVVHLAD